MRFFTLLIVLVEFVFSTIIHKPPVDFIPMFPVSLKISFSKSPKLVQILYKHLSNIDFRIKTMKCKENKCKVVIPTSQNSPLQYLFQVKETKDDNNLIQSKRIEIPIRKLPNWEVFGNTSEIIILGADADLEGFDFSNVVFNSDKNPQRMIKYKKNNSLIEFSTKKLKPDEVLSEFADDPQNENENDNENEFKNIEHNKQISNYRELFTP